MRLTNKERDRILAALFELTITDAENDDNWERSEALTVKFGGDPNAMFFGPMP